MAHDNLDDDNYDDDYDDYDKDYEKDYTILSQCGSILGLCRNRAQPPRQIVLIIVPNYFHPTHPPTHFLFLIPSPTLVYPFYPSTSLSYLFLFLFFFLISFIDRILFLIFSFHYATIFLTPVLISDYFNPVTSIYLYDIFNEINDYFSFSFYFFFLFFITITSH